ncbi:ABC transporter substrate-binding protein [Cohnella zeiphila]|uniref:Carbohydrate ABC transporter substrate-binding protein n=1 Tax=Cohnella zeiphila TaxID=2761120 RepID=A0A7X0SHL9_9BACL|nr:ABC transporter substrate-binding protein [Cohnella zeiphila]MBB6730031.1 carbohydrate ABC transporter substrate-binding protein [Cohnella zeiphila]
MRSRMWLVAASIALLAAAFFWMMERWMERVDFRASDAGAEAPVNLVWYHHFREEGARKWLEIGTSRYMKAHPNVTVQVISDDGGTYPNTLHNLAAIERMPDIYMADSISSLEEFIDAGYAMNLTGRPIVQDFDPQQLSGVRKPDGSVWAVPFDRNGVGVFYNRDAFRKAGIQSVPRTWEAFLDACRKLEQAGIKPIAAGYQDTWTLMLDIQPDLIVSGIGQPAWIEDVEAGRASFEDDKGGLRGILQRLAERFPFTGPEPFRTSWNDALEQLASGEAGMIVNGTWTVDGVRSFKPDADIGMFAFPASDRPEEARFEMKTTGGFVVNPKSRHVDAALDLVRYFTTPEMARVFQDNKKGISIAKGATLDFDPAYEELDRDYVQTGRILDYSAFYPDFVNAELGNAFRTGLIQFLYDPRHDVDKCLAMLDEAFDRIRPRAGTEGRG